jgi:thiol:disulfide interchange protein
MRMRNLVGLLVLMVMSFSLEAQITKNPTHWNYTSKKISGNDYELIITCTLDEHWHIWSLDPGGDGLLFAPAFKFTKNPDYTLVGSVKESGKRIDREFSGTDGITHSYEKKVTYTQKIKVKKNTVIEGKHDYQVCNESKCLTPEFDVKFKIDIKDLTTSSADTLPPTSVDTLEPTTAVVTPPASTTEDSVTKPIEPSTVKASSPTTSGAVELDDVSKKPLWQILLLAFLAGLAAVTTPCIYSMVPLTVSLFTKQNNDRKNGIRKATFYAFSIVIIFALLGMIITAVWGSDGLYKLSTNWIANLFFFILFVIFGFSFLGAFEIKLPSKWSTAADKKSNASSYFGIFFMALTLVIVSFSCTSAFIGGIAVWASKGGFWGPFLGFGMFGLGLGLPFAFFALFPNYLKNLEKPGGWQNALKVTLGFLELALALKFLSNADLAKGWRLLDREIFIAIWIVLAVLLGMYLLGKLKFFNDSELKKNYFDIPFVSTFRLVLASASFVFAIYLLPGMIGAPLNGMSAFLPPMGTHGFPLGSFAGGTPSNTSHGSGETILYREDLKIYEPATVTSLGLHTYFDFEQAKAAAKREGKPLMLDFTGITCVNCRKMESEVWSNPEVLKILKNDFIIVSLYCDAFMINTDKKNEEGEPMSLGQYNLNLQKSKFNSNSQPFYFFIDHDEKLLASNGYDYQSNIQAFVQHLEKVKQQYNEFHPK